MATTPSPIAGIRTPVNTTGVKPDIPADLAVMSGDLDMLTVPKFDSVAARDTAYSAKTSAQKVGAVCYIRDREGHCYWYARDNKWMWIGQNRVIFIGAFAGRIDLIGSGTNTTTSLVAMPTITLPQGNRLIEINASSAPQNNSTNQAFPNIYINNTISGGASSKAQGYIPAGTFGITLQRTWLQVLSGTINADLRGGNDTGAMIFRESTLTIIDRGPTDA